MSRAATGTRSGARPSARPASAPPASKIVAGIDEAGLGPLLGPLAIGWSVFRLPEGGADPWKLLRGTVHKTATARAKLVVADSKRVHSRTPVGRKRLETTVLTFLSLRERGLRLSREPRDLLFGAVRPDAEVVARHPWYAKLPELPRELEPATLELGTAVLERKLRARSLALLDAGVRLVPAGELNASYARTNNKGATVWRRCLEVLRHLWKRHGEAGPDVTVDLLGGRIHYADLLAKGFPDARVTTLFEEPEHAAYVLDEENSDAAWLPRRMRIDFRAKGEDASFAVALASCIAKYSRELVMEGFNAYFGELQPDLAPTAGYTTDGRRWLEDARRAIAASGVARECLTRDR